jgi:hypothetical protein
MEYLCQFKGEKKRIRSFFEILNIFVHFEDIRTKTKSFSFKDGKSAEKNYSSIY